MISKRNYFIIILVFSSIFLNAQVLFENASVRNKINYSLPEERVKIDLSKSPGAALNLQLNKSNLKTNNGWYPKKGEIYFVSETEIAGYSYYEVSGDGLLDKKISVYDHPDFYDSTVIVMNRTQYSKGKDLYDTVYNYYKKPDGTYVSDKRTTYSYHYFDHFEGDSLFFEEITQYWDNTDKQWINYYKIKFGYHDTLVQFNNRTSIYTYGDNNTWKLYDYWYDSISYNNKGFVDSLYRIINNGITSNCTYKVGFTNDEQGRYTHVRHYMKQGNIWTEVGVSYDVTWIEWNGFMFGDERAIGKELLSPYKRSKVNSYYRERTSTGGKSFYKKLWDIDGTLSNSDGQYFLIDEQLYPADVFKNCYNKHGDFIEWINESYSEPDENGNQRLITFSTILDKYSFDETYGKTGCMQYLINLLNDGTIDTAFYYGEKYTEFAYFESIQEYPQKTIQPLIIAPNPASGIVNISAQEEIIQLNIFSITGKLVNKQYPVSNQVTFDVGILPKGIYNVQAIFESGNLQTGKLVVE
ncbi:MAG: T9SS type A sorting domain-containing protein [Bacteroidales bacterium]|jgi:hypothetical protein|nr:T9SS type A sorting domain-containing protein [Bacteroidales bacterium]